jgi:hypothetical protein
MRETFAYIHSFAGFPRALRAYLREPLTLCGANGRCSTPRRSRKNVQSTIEFLVKANALPAGTRTAPVVDFSYLNAVLADIGQVAREPATPKSTP